MALRVIADRLEHEAGAELRAVPTEANLIISRYMDFN